MKDLLHRLETAIGRLIRQRPMGGEAYERAPGRAPTATKPRRRIKQIDSQAASASPPRQSQCRRDDRGFKDRAKVAEARRKAAAPGIQGDREGCRQPSGIRPPSVSPCRCRPPRITTYYSKIASASATLHSF